MKVFIFLLLLANLLLFMWQWLQPTVRAEANESVSLPELSVQGIQLRGEHNEEGKAVEVTESVKRNVAESSMETELPDNNTQSSDESLKTATQSEPMLVSHCFKLGSYNDPADINALMVSLVKAGLTSASLLETQEDVTEQVKHWVLITPYTSLDEARRAVKRLKEAKLKDFFLVRSGDMANAISLGVFSTLAAAQSRLKQLQKMKLRVKAPVIQQKKSTKSQYWALIKLDSDSAEETEKHLAKLAEKDVEAVSCGD